MKVGLWMRAHHHELTHSNRFRGFTGSLERMSSTTSSGKVSDLVISISQWYSVLDGAFGVYIYNEVTFGNEIAWMHKFFFG